MNVKPVAAALGGVGGGQMAAVGATAVGAGLLGGTGAYTASRRAADKNADGSELLEQNKGNGNGGTGT